MLGGFLLRWIFNAIAIYITTRIITGIRLPNTESILIAALVLGLVNASIRWVLLVLTLPLNILTLGLFTLVVNALMLYVVAAVTPMQIDSFGSAFLGALLIAIISTFLSHLSGR
ncbi:MAG: phage holin family protein [Armatimonadetes bacterium]|nr:phage holin family protein [Armatimonadota bacterium]